MCLNVVNRCKICYSQKKEAVDLTSNSVFVEPQNLHDICSEIYAKRINPFCVDISDNLILAYLYDRYCELESKDDTFAKLKERAVKAQDDKEYRRACTSIKKWYSNHYELSEDGELKSSNRRRGEDRRITKKRAEEGNYCFDEPVSNSLFNKYLINEQPSGSTDTFDFILHCAVAFTLTPKSLNDILKKYGYHGLNIRNIHHVAIYSVLSEATVNPPIGNPFEAVKELYYTAIKSIDEKCSEVDTEKSASIDILMRGSKTTTTMRQAVMGNDYTKNLPHEKALELIIRDSDFFNMFHNRLLAEHRQMATLFKELYWNDGLRKKYALPEFLMNYCKSFTKDHVSENMFGRVSGDKQHPTREFMIVLWMYSYCFLFLPNVPVPDRIRTKPAFEKSCDEKNLNVVKFLSTPMMQTHKDVSVESNVTIDAERALPLNGFGHARVGASFDGAEMVAFLNQKLSGYSWRSLDGHYEFDRVILALRDFELRERQSGEFILMYGKMTKCEVRRYKLPEIDGVPAPLVFLHMFMQTLKNAAVKNKADSETIEQESASEVKEESEKEENLVYLPLGCKLFEVI